MTLLRPRLLLPSPDLACPPTGLVGRAGLRPHRRGTFRLEVEPLGSKLLVHNYGHGGAGITMSWGCAAAVRDLVAARRPTGPNSEVAVLGGGVMGLTAATRLREANYAVTIYAEAFSDTTSDVAGGQWAPSVVEYERTPTGRARFASLLRDAYDAHRNNIGKGFGVVHRTNYGRQKSPGLEKAVDAKVLDPPKFLPHLPFERLASRGWAYETLLVETPIFLRRLREDLQSHVQFQPRRFRSREDVMALSEPIVVNCTGIGARNLFNDMRLEPVKGHIVFLEPQPALEYLYSSGSTYVFPRSDHVVVGGSYEHRGDTTVDPVRLGEILTKARNEFNGMTLKFSQRRGWMRMPR